MKNLFTCLLTVICGITVVLLTSCGGGKTYEGPLGAEATIAGKHIEKLQSMDEKMRDLAKSASNMKEAMELQKEINDYNKTAGEELEKVKVQNPNGKAVPFEQKAFKDAFEIADVVFVGYNISANGKNIQAHFQSKVKALKADMPKEFNADFVDAAGNILLKDKFYIGVSAKAEPDKIIVTFCNPNEFGKILNLAKIIVE
jgi:hypothetical protein